uniref:Uncharacterized protein n=1 Tax=Romanomermis culicivorax TaxID=13658 RepID=A0A915HRF4_ROMCU
MDLLELSVSVVELQHLPGSTLFKFGRILGVIISHFGPANSTLGGDLLMFRLYGHRHLDLDLPGLPLAVPSQLL